MMERPLTESESQQAWADSMTDEEREAYEDGIAQRRAERQAESPETRLRTVTILGGIALAPRPLGPA